MVVYNRTRARDRHEPVDEVLELERELNERQAPDVNPSLVHDIKVHPLAFNRSYFASDISSEAIKAAAPTILHYLNSLNGRSSPPYTEEEKQLRWFTRYQGQVHARRVYFAMQHLADSRKQGSSLLYAQEKFLLEQEFVFYRRICLDFTLLELREKGKLPAWEAILLVKERQQV